MKVFIRRHEGDEIIVRCRKTSCPDEELLTFLVPASAVPHEMLCEIFKHEGTDVSKRPHINTIFDYHYDQVKLFKSALDGQNDDVEKIAADEMKDLFYQWNDVEWDSDLAIYSGHLTLVGLIAERFGIDKCIEIIKQDLSLVKEIYNRASVGKNKDV